MVARALPLLQGDSIALERADRAGSRPVINVTGVTGVTANIIPTVDSPMAQ
jgi:hypothetical protein